MAVRSIAFVCNECQIWCTGGGIGSFTQEMARCLSEKDITVYIIGCTEDLNHVKVIREGNVYVKGIPYYRIPRFAPWINRFRLSLHLRVLVGKYDIDLIECPEYLGWLWPFKQEKPVVIRFHSSSRLSLWERLKNKEQYPWWARFERTTIVNGTKHCAVSHYLAERLKETLPFMAGREIEVIHNGIDTRFFMPSDNKRRSIKSAVFVGKITQAKGVLELLKAWEIVCQKEHGAKLYLLGRDGPGSNGHPSMKEELIAKYQQLVDMGRIAFLGLADKRTIREKLLQATLCVFPSRHEANPISLLEAMACGCPVVCSNHTGFLEVVQDGHNGLLCNTDNEIELAEAIIRLLRDKPLRVKLGSNARATVLERFDSRKLLAKNLELYERALSGR